MTKNANLRVFFIVLLSLFFSSSNNAQIPLIPYDSLDILLEGESLPNPLTGGLNCPQFSSMDLDGDGRQDLVLFERNFYGSVKTFLNTGAEGVIGFKYAPEFQNRFPRISNWMLLRDYNCDGKEDIFASVPAGVAVYKNVTQEGSEISFSPVTSLLITQGLNGSVPLYVSPPDIPAIADIDNDGDLDILAFNVLGSTVEYHKNLSMENNGNCEELEFELKNACWGYFSEDGNTNSVVLFDTCEINVPDPEKSSKHPGSTILAIDMAGNGVKDIIVGDLAYNNLVFLKNGGTTTASSITDFETDFPSNTTAVDLTVFPASFWIDVNNDDVKDLIVAPNNPNTSENTNNIWYYQNTGSNTVPQFEFIRTDLLVDGMIDAGERSFPTFFDENGDGLMDIIVGNFGYFETAGSYSSQLMLLRNTGTSSEPAFEIISSDYAGLGELGFNGIYPTFGDMDNDGDMDMITGDEDGLLHYFRNDAETGAPADFTLSMPNYMGIDVGQSAKPQIVDVNRDGLPDLIVGERSGLVNYYQNTGTPETADFNSLPTNDFFGQIDVMPECCTGYSTPFLVEDSVGNYLLYVGSEQGILYLFNEIENNLGGSFNLVDSLYLHGVNINVSGFDINGDDKTEMVLGEFGGGIRMLKYGIPQGLSVRQNKKPELILSAYPNPAKEWITFQLKKTELPKAIHINIFNQMGNLVRTSSINHPQENHRLFIGDLVKGIYFVEVRGFNFSTHVRIIKI